MLSRFGARDLHILLPVTKRGTSGTPDFPTPTPARPLQQLYVCFSIFRRRKSKTTGGILSPYFATARSTDTSGHLKYRCLVPPSAIEQQYRARQRADVLPLYPTHTASPVVSPRTALFQQRHGWGDAAREIQVSRSAVIDIVANLSREIFSLASSNSFRFCRLCAHASTSASTAYTQPSSIRPLCSGCVAELPAGLPVGVHMFSCRQGRAPPLPSFNFTKGHAGSYFSVA